MDNTTRKTLQEKHNKVISAKHNRYSYNTTIKVQGNNKFTPIENLGYITKMIIILAKIIVALCNQSRVTQGTTVLVYNVTHNSSSNNTTNVGQ
jgi:hypothetical protein